MKMLILRLCAYNLTIHINNLRLMHIRRVDLYRKCYNILGVEEGADQNTVRKAYLELVKKLHPDSGSAEACEERFIAIDEAFKILQEKFAKDRHGIHVDEEENVPDINHTAPQHRQYLSHDGYGYGNPFQRQKQYQQIRAMKAQECVLQHRLDKSQADEKTIMKKEGQFFKSHAIKTKYGLDRLVEDYIQEAMSKGNFNNLKGAGKPLPDTQMQNPYLDFTTHKLNKILLDNGFTPEWITLQRDIRSDLKILKNKLKEERRFFGEYPLKSIEANDWQIILSKYKEDEERINKNIDKYNLIVPIIDHQFFRLNLQKLSDDILQDATAPRNQSRPIKSQSNTTLDKSPNNSKNIFDFLGSFF